jgi:CelD/BcsL family acetyltransferase involved in cellulose biosynthesis
MQVLEITNPTALERIYPSWVSLWERVPTATPFQHPDWLLPWWRHLGGGALFVIAIQDGGDLAALAPFYVHQDEKAGVRQLTLLGNGITDTCDLLIEKDRPNVLHRLTMQLSGSRWNVWDGCDFRDVPGCSALIPLMQGAFGAEVVGDEPRVVVALESWTKDEGGALPTRIRADLRRRRKRAEEVGGVRFELAKQGCIRDSLECLFALHTARWNALGQSGVLGQPNVAAFHLEVAERFGRRGWLRLYRLHIGGRIGAANYGFCVRRRAYYYIGGFATEFAQLGPGGLILDEMIRQAAAEGATEFDFLRGHEDYKLKWRGKVVQQYRMQLPMGGARDPESERLACTAP